MIKPEQIPDEVIDALKESTPWSSFWADHDTKLFLAIAINAWPQGWSLEENDTASIMETAGVFLPLPQEKNDG